MSSDELTVHLTLTAVPSAARVPVKVAKDDSPAKLRKKAAEATKIPLGSLRLIFRGRMISNDETKLAVDEFKLEEGCVIHCMGKPVEAAAPGAAAASGTTSATGSTVTLGSGTDSSATASSDPLQAALTTLRSSNTASVFLTAVTTLDKILDNIAKNPMEEKYRKVKRGNAAFQKRLGGLSGGHDAMLAAGFVVQTVGGEECYMITPSPQAWPKLMEAKAAIATAVTEAKSAAGQAAAPPPAAAAAAGLPNPMMPNPMMGGGLGGMPPMGGMGGMPQLTPQMQQMAAQMMSDPNQLQAMLQNPMVQQMLRNDPRFANNPMMQNMINNPQMLAQMSSMMSDPAMQQQMQNMMRANPDMQQQMQNMMGQPGGFGAPPPSAAGVASAGGQQQQGGSNNNDNSSQTDQEMTEDELLQEAIRRSLRES